MYQKMNVCGVEHNSSDIVTDNTSFVHLDVNMQGDKREKDKDRKHPRARGYILKWIVL